MKAQTPTDGGSAHEDGIQSNQGYEAMKTDAIEIVSVGVKAWAMEKIEAKRPARSIETQTPEEITQAVAAEATALSVESWTPEGVVAKQDVQGESEIVETVAEVAPSPVSKDPARRQPIQSISEAIKMT